MAGKRRLTAGLPRLFGRMNTAQGRAFGRAGAALARRLGIPATDTDLMLWVGLVARTQIELEAVSRDLAEARERRERGRGRRPGEGRIERLSTRFSSLSRDYTERLAALEILPEVRSRVAKLKQAEAVAAYRARQAPSRPQPASSFPGSLPSGRGQEGGTGGLEPKMALTPTSARGEEGRIETGGGQR